MYNVLGIHGELMIFSCEKSISHYRKSHHLIGKPLEINDQYLGNASASASQMKKVMGHFLALELASVFRGGSILYDKMLNL